MSSTSSSVSAFYIMTLWLFRRNSCFQMTPLPLPRPLPIPLPIPLPALPGIVPPPLAVPFTPPCPPTPTYPDVEFVPAFPLPRPLPLDPLVALPAAVSTRLRSSSSAFRAAASRRWCSSISLLSAACCFSTLSFSIFATSWLAPRHEGLRIRR